MNQATTTTTTTITVPAAPTDKDRDGWRRIVTDLDYDAKGGFAILGHTVGGGDPSLRAYRDEIGDVQWHHQFAAALWRGIPADALVRARSDATGVAR